MSLFLDFIIVLVFVLCIITGVRRGFIRSVMGIVIVVAAIIGSIKFTPKVAEYLNKNYITPGITSKVEKSIDSVVNGVESVDLKKLFSEKSKALTDILENSVLSSTMPATITKRKPKSPTIPRNQSPDSLQSLLPKRCRRQLHLHCCSSRYPQCSE
mgnify:CR=1 FL=1